MVAFLISSTLCSYLVATTSSPSTTLFAISSGNPKYVLGTFLNYVDGQKFNRVGDKTLGSEGL